MYKDLDEDINGVIIKFWTAESKFKKYFGKGYALHKQEYVCVGVCV